MSNNNLDPITYEPIPANRRVRINYPNSQGGVVSRAYNVNTLNQIIRRGGLDPFTREPLSNQVVNSVYRTKNRLDPARGAAGRVIVNAVRRALNTRNGGFNLNNARAHPAYPRLVDHLSKIVESNSKILTFMNTFATSALGAMAKSRRYHAPTVRRLVSAIVSIQALQDESPENVISACFFWLLPVMLNNEPMVDRLTRRGLFGNRLRKAPVLVEAYVSNAKRLNNPGVSEGVSYNLSQSIYAEPDYITRTKKAAAYIIKKFA